MAFYIRKSRARRTALAAALRLLCGGGEDVYGFIRRNGARNDLLDGVIDIVGGFLFVTVTDTQPGSLVHNLEGLSRFSALQVFLDR